MRIHGVSQSGLMGGVGIALGALLTSCNSLDKPAEDKGPTLVIPLDQRPAVKSTQPARAIMGGTLTVLKDGTKAVVTDPERDRVSIVGLAPLAVLATIELQPGDEPWRSVEDDAERVHVSLRGSGAIVTIDTEAATLLERRAVCKAPRGLAFEATSQLVHVACKEGTLVSLPAAGGDPVRTITLEPDLRDVLVQGNELWVTRFKSAEILRVQSTGTVSARLALPKNVREISKPPPQTDKPEPGVALTKQVTVTSGVAWRAVSNPAGGAVLVNQEEVDDEIVISEPSPSGSAYGGEMCGGIVKNAVTRISPDGTVTSTPFMGDPLPVDVAISPSRQKIAVAHAGQADVSAPRPIVVSPGQEGDAAPSASGLPFPSGGNVTVMSLDNLGSGCALPEAFLPIPEPATAVAFTPSGLLLVQTREPARLYVVNDWEPRSAQALDLGGDSRLDTGHELFHRDAGGGIACATCHPEGGEDGHTWHFAGSGARRTQALHVGLRDTAPFHWAGDLPDVAAVMDQIFVGRMGGIRENAERTGALADWLFSIERPPSLRDASDPAAVRGKVLFESAEVGCSSCHAGAKLTNNETVAIDSAAEKLQVPSLVGIAYRAPFMHDGCAATLTARFDPACGGNAHGNTTNLSKEQLGDLVAYLESL